MDPGALLYAAGELNICFSVGFFSVIQLRSWWMELIKDVFFYIVAGKVLVRQ